MILTIFFRLKYKENRKKDFIYKNKYKKNKLDNIKVLKLYNKS